jgi:hypothetical protein
MTYEELAGMLDCSVMEARERVHIEGLDRKISRDGHKRAKLDAALTAIFIERLRTIDVVVDQAVEDLKYIQGLLREADRPRRLTSWLRPRQAG